jgi:hypothetical protein
MAKSGDDLARGVDAESRPQDRKIEPSSTIFGETIAAPADRTNQAVRTKAGARAVPFVTTAETLYLAVPAIEV